MLFQEEEYGHMADVSNAIFRGRGRGGVEAKTC